MYIEGFQHIKYADDTTFFKPVHHHANFGAITPAIASTQLWSHGNNIILNPDKTTLMNLVFSSRNKHTIPMQTSNINLELSKNAKFLGFIIIWLPLLFLMIMLVILNQNAILNYFNETANG